MDSSFDLVEVTASTRANIGTGYGNVGAIQLNNFAIAIDSTLYTKTGRLFREKIEEIFGVQVKYVVYTHYHGDHVFGSEAFQKTDIISSEITLKHIQGGHHEGWRQELEKNEPLAEGKVVISMPTITFTSSHSIIDQDKEIQIIHLGGHTEGSSVIFYPKEKVIFAGDIIFNNMFPYAGDPTCNPEDWIAAMRKIRNMDCTWIIPGHGPILNGKDELEKIIDFFIYLKSQINAGIDAKRSIEEISNAIEVPAFFTEASEWRKPELVENWYNYYTTAE
ncbi:MAG: MBL fold metallo-hydrolase [Candidatus Kariarchaeaceae archaeon]|jgi:glyoxylase-like metal-dependent hydrolase (beta-lactamase superfamily II)